MDFKMQNKHFLITGASGGIGSEITKVFLQEQAKVTAHFNTKDDSLKNLLNQYPDSLLQAKANLQQEADVKKLFTQAVEKFGRIDGLVANAGIWPKENTPIQEMSLERWNNTLVTDITSVFLCVKYFCQNLVAKPGETGSIVLIGSTAGVFGEANHCDYAVAKSAMVGLMMSVKNEIIHIASKGRINIINPGWTLVSRNKQSLENKKNMKRILQTIPMRKIAQTSDIAHTVLFLSSEITAGHISGQILTVAGGMEGRVLFEPEEINI